MRILVVDDSVTMRRIVIDAVRSFCSEEIIEAESAEEALEIIGLSTDIRLVLLDFHLPGMTGLDMLKKMRLDPRMARIPVVMVTTEREKPSVISALRAGASNYIVKPFTHQIMRKKVGSILDAPEDTPDDSAGGLVGSLGQTSPWEVIQLIAMTKKTGVLMFSGEDKEYQIFFSNGQIQHASGGDSTGEDAVAEATALREGTFTFNSDESEHPVTIRRSTEILMLNAFSNPGS